MKAITTRGPRRCAGHSGIIFAAVSASSAPFCCSDCCNDIKDDCTGAQEKEINQLVFFTTTEGRC